MSNDFNKPGKFYLVLEHERWEDALASHQGDYYRSVQEALDWGMLYLEPGVRYFVCDEKGAVLAVDRSPRLSGNA